MKMNLLTLFPEMFTPITESILGRAEEKGILEFNFINIRDYTLDKHKKVDDTPYGGGQGMLMAVQPVTDALRSINAKGKKILYMSPRGKVLNEEMIREYASLDELTILCGHYEGVDQRVLDYWDMEEVSIGDYVLTGGELPAMVLIDAVARLIPGVLSGEASATEESIYSGLLEYPQYTRPREYEGMEVPEVLVNGNHKLIKLWKLEKSLELTQKRRPDLFENFVKNQSELSKDEHKVLEKILK